MLIDEGYNPKLGDFGASRESDKVTSTMRGTPLYAAPEMLRTEVINEKIDQWAFACCLEVMWTHEAKLYSSREMPVEDILNGVATGTVFPRVPRASFLADLVCATSAYRPIGTSPSYMPPPPHDLGFACDDPVLGTPSSP